MTPSKTTAAMVSAWLFGLEATAILVSPAHAQQWVFQGGKQTNNGSVTVKSVDGSTSQSATQNPTGAAAKVNQTAVTQPPVVVMQATAKLPVVVEGAACNSTIDQAGIKADLSALYGCQANVWVRVNNDPIVAENSACNTTYDRSAISSDRTKVLTCQAGQWKASASGGVTTGGGKSQIWKALSGQTISCSLPHDYSGRPYGYGTVDANGVPYVRVYWPGAVMDSGWQQRVSVTATTPSNPGRTSPSPSALQESRLPTEQTSAPRYGPDALTGK